MTTERIKELEAKVAELTIENNRLERSLTNAHLDIERQQDNVEKLLGDLEHVDCGSAQLNRTASTCRRHETCLTCERDELRAELEKLRQQGRQDAA